MMNDYFIHRNLIKNNADALAQHGTSEDNKLAIAQMCFVNCYSIHIAKLRAILKNHDVKLEHASNNKQEEGQEQKAEAFFDINFHRGTQSSTED